YMFISLLAQRNEPKKCVAQSPRWLRLAQPKSKTKTVLNFGSLACISCFPTEPLSTKWRYPLRWKSDVVKVKGKGQGQGQRSRAKVKGKG
ncbi:MAG: hypothetical protein GX365_05545, partial [Clostridiales bacterium]|nr:hypothetical protein [Clostridiales bacterium]